SVQEGPPTIVTMGMLWTT
nr:immunoglobulin heavy chain junction region [Mus musculus]